jgi:AraC-like DNA-binding protein
MPSVIPVGTVIPPAGRPNWGGSEDLALLYLGWGQRDFATAPLKMHRDLGTNYYLVLRGGVLVSTGEGSHETRGPVALLFAEDCAFGISQVRVEPVEILVWIWRGEPLLPELKPAPGGFRTLELRAASMPDLADLHERCREEVALADTHLPRALGALRELLEVRLLRANQAAPPEEEMRWKLARAWIAGNLSIHAPVPALCDYLRMSPSTLRRFFHARTGTSPGDYFRQAKADEARRLIHEEGWQVKAAAYHLGYRHPNDLSRALSGRGRR